MKKLNIKSYLAGVITTVTLLALTVGVFAATTGMTISVNSDIKLKVGGEDFVPKDAAGKPVFVFEYNGTTYVPMRAISEKLGYKIGYDNATRTAMIGKTDVEVGVKTTPPTLKVVDPNHVPTITLDEMKAMFKFPSDKNSKTYVGDRESYYCQYNGKLAGEELTEYWGSLDKNDIEIAMQKWALEVSKEIGQTSARDIQLTLGYYLNENSRTASSICYGIEKQFYSFRILGAEIL